MSLRVGKHSADGLAEVRSDFRRLQRREWLHWAFALMVIILLTLGILSLSLGVGRPDILELWELKLAANGLLGLVLLFDVYAVYQQVLINRLRNDLASQIGVLATLEALKDSDDDQNHSRRKERRAMRRCYFDSLVKVKRSDGKKTIFGRTRDVSELGLGAVIPESLSRGETVTLEFNVEDLKLKVSAIVRHRQGFHHGFELIGLKEEESEALRQFCEQDLQVECKR
jgi:hypothetical protein